MYFWVNEKSKIDDGYKQLNRGIQLLGEESDEIKYREKDVVTLIYDFYKPLYCANIMVKNTKLKYRSVKFLQTQHLYNHHVG